MMRTSLCMLAVGLACSSALAAEFILEAWSVIPGGGPGTDIMPAPGAPLPLNDDGEPVIFIPPNVEEPLSVQIVLMVSTDLDTGVGGVDLGLDQESTLFGEANPTGVYSGTHLGLPEQQPDPFVKIGQLWAFMAWQVDESGDASDWQQMPGSGYDADLDTFFGYPFASQIGNGYIEDPDGNFYLASAVGQPLGECEPDFGGGGVPYQFLYLALNVAADETQPGDSRFVSVAGLGGLCSALRPSNWDWLGRWYDYLPDGEVPWGRILVVRPACAGDFNEDGQRDYTDFTVFAQAWLSHLGEPDYDARADFDASGSINFTDYTAFSAIYGTACPPE